MISTVSKNLKRFRLAKKMTQEQAAEALGVSAQTVSRWECATTWPDAAMLPQIARLYGITIDDLYKESSFAYENYAQRLGSVYEATRKLDDFLWADKEYRRMVKDGTASAEDLRLYGILYQYMMEDCRDQALALFDRVLNQDPVEDQEAYWRTKRQKLCLYAQTGRAEEAVAEQQRAVSAGPGNVEEWICLIAAYQNAGRLQEAAEWMQKARTRFPENACLYVYCGNVYASLKQYEDAFSCWEKAMQMDPTYMDALYAKGFCLEEMGEYERACEVWSQLADTMERRGYDVEANAPRQLAEKCRAKMEK